MEKAIALSEATGSTERNTPAIGVFVAGDPRIDADSRQRCRNICQMVADALAERVKLPDGSPAKVVWAPTLVDGEAQADIVAKQFQDAGVKVLVCTPDTWAFPQLSVISLLSAVPDRHADQLHLRQQRPQAGRRLRARGQRRARAVRPTVASQRRHLARYRPEPGHDRGHGGGAGRLGCRGDHDAGAQGPPRRRLRPRLDGHGDRLAHVIPTRKQFGLEITRLDMKLLADMLNKKAYNAEELKALRAFVDGHLGKRLELRDDGGFGTLQPEPGALSDHARSAQRPGCGRRRLHEPARMGLRHARHPAARGRCDGVVLQLHVRSQRAARCRCRSPPRPTCRGC